MEESLVEGFRDIFFWGVTLDLSFTLSKADALGMS